MITEKVIKTVTSDVIMATYAKDIDILDPDNEIVKTFDIPIIEKTVLYREYHLSLITWSVRDKMIRNQPVHQIYV